MPRQSNRTFLTCLLVILSLTTAVVTPTRAQDTAGITDLGVEYSFGDQITFRAQFEPADEFSEGWVTFGGRGEADTHVEPLVVSLTGELSYTYRFDQGPIHPFVQVDYHFSVQRNNGKTVDSPNFSFHYIDNRFVWETLESGGFQIYWYEGDPAFAQFAADVAQEGLQRASTIMPFADPGSVDIYIYASMDEMALALPINGFERVVGHADPGLSLIVVSLPPGGERRLLAEQAIPHEIMHILLYHKTGFRTSTLPAWLNEGLASLNELYPDPNYQILLENAVKENRLLPINQLCQSFPSDTSGVALAYAEAASFTRYLHRTYGSSALEALVAGYADGLSCERGVEVAYTQSLTDLDLAWQTAAFAGTEEVEPEQENLLPWLLIISAAVAVPLIAALTGMRKPLSPKSAHGR